MKVDNSRDCTERAPAIRVSSCLDRLWSDDWAIVKKAIVLIIVLEFCQHPPVVRADIVLLNASALPQDQGWLASRYPDTPAVQIENEALVFNTVGVGLWSLFYRSAPTTQENPFSVEFRLKVLKVTIPHDQYDSAIVFYPSFVPESTLGSGVDRSQMIYFDVDRIGWGDDEDTFFMSTTDGFHTYRLDVLANRSATVSVDGIVRLHRTTIVPNGIVAFGDMENSPGMDSKFALEFITISADCNGNAVADDLDIADGFENDCNGNLIADSCEVDCNQNLIPDTCDITDGNSRDVDSNHVPDECQADCNHNLVPDEFELAQGQQEDCNGDEVPDECGLSDGSLTDGDANGVPDQCEKRITYVRIGAPPHGDGTSWANAFGDLGEALLLPRTLAGETRELWVAEGIYIPSRRTDMADPRSATFQLGDGVALLGGFEGNEMEVSQRNWEQNLTVLSGDLLGNDGAYFANRSDNLYHVLTKSDEGTSVALDGFIVRGGFASGGTSQGGGGLLARGTAVLRNCLFEDNGAGELSRISDMGTVAKSGGGGAIGVKVELGLEGTSLTCENCVFRGNVSADSGGAISVTYGGLFLKNCTFERNRGRFGGAVFGSFDTLYVQDSTFSENESTAYSTSIGGGAIVTEYVEDLRIRGSTFEDNHAELGGALHLVVLGSVQIIGTSFAENQASTYGGAIYLGGSSSGSIEDCVFDRNRALLGGAIYFDHTDLGMPIIRSVFTNNHVQYSGGALYTTWSPLRVSSSTFLHNWAGDYGGVISARSDSLIEDCLFDDNYADYGGALYLHGPADPGKLVRNTFLQNDAIVGGGLSFYGGALAIDDCEFMQNHASIGGAMSLTGDEVISVRDTVMVSNSSRFGGAVEAGTGFFALENCTVANNSASTFGGGVLGDEGSSIQNCIFWDNSTGTGITEEELVRDEAAQIEGLGLIDVQYSIVEGWTGNYPGSEVRSDDPLFRIPVRGPNWNDPLHSDLRLQHSSPAVNAGDPAYETSLGDLDLDGHTRVLCGRVEMGAYESGIGDADCDGVVDLSDFAAMVECAEGIDESPTCKQVDFDNDGDFDLLDFAGMQRVMGEP